MIDRARLLGTWDLRTWTATGTDGSVEEPFGTSPEGVLVYASDGTMVALIGRQGRPPISGGDILMGPTEEIVAMATSFIAYGGTWSVDGSDVIHDVTMSLFPDWIGTEQRRHVELSPDGERLTLRTDPMVLRGRLSVQALTWERAHDSRRRGGRQRPPAGRR